MVDAAIRRMGLDDVSAVVAVHLEAFSGFFLSFLGARFLRELYAALVTDPSGIGYVYEQGGAILGLVAGTDQPAGFYQRLVRLRWWRFGLASIVPLLKRPAIAPRLLRAFSRPKQVVHHTNCGTLMSIAVLPGEQGRGLGRALATAFLQEAAARGLEWVNLTTDEVENESANAFYLRLGFQHARSYVTPEGRLMNEYLIGL